MDKEHQNEEYQNDIPAEESCHTGEVHSEYANTEPTTADLEYENDNQEYEYIQFSEMRMRKLPEIKTETGLFASQSGQWRDIRKSPFIAFSFLVLLSLILAIAALVMACLRCFSECPDGWTKMDEKCYNFSSATSKWDPARKHCKNAGADLVVIDSEQEQDFLNYKMGNTEFWIGLFYDEETWKWVNSKNEFYRNWDRNMEPEKSGDYYLTCVASKKDTPKKWNSKPCQHRTTFICEKNRHVACVLKSPVLPL